MLPCVDAARLHVAEGANIPFEQVRLCSQMVLLAGLSMGRFCLRLEHGV
jgi:hypothetical protein